jgi:hypothetical protein
MRYAQAVMKIKSALKKRLWQLKNEKASFVSSKQSVFAHLFVYPNTGIATTLETLKYPVFFGQCTVSDITIILCNLLSMTTTVFLILWKILFSLCRSNIKIGRKFHVLLFWSQIQPFTIKYRNELISYIYGLCKNYHMWQTDLSDKCIPVEKVKKVVILPKQELRLLLKA